MKKIFITSLFALSLMGPLSYAHAETSTDLAVTPAVIDEKAEQRDILKESVTVKNNSNHVLQLYPSVNDVSNETGEKPFVQAADASGLSNSLSNWIELTRGMVQVSPGEEKAIPFIVRINQNAVAGTYHAQISFTEGSTRAEADAGPTLGTVTVNVEIKANIKELLELNKFTTGNMYFSGDDVLFNYQLQNIGNQELQPKGKIMIYNRNGQEVADVDVNKDNKTISPDQMAQMASAWSAANGFGRYKALLTVDYGISQTATVQDTVFFWVIPWKQMLTMFIVSLVTIIILALYFHNWLERRHLYKFAHAGLLNEDTLQKIQEPELHMVHMPLPLEEPKIDKKTHAQQKRRFGVFKRKEVRVPEHQAVYMEQQKQSRAEEREEVEHKSLKEVLQKQDRPTTEGHSIDLKQLRAHAQATQSHAYVTPEQSHTHKAHVDGHVISLKKKS